jgi:hypothetical protein
MEHTFYFHQSSTRLFSHPLASERVGGGRRRIPLAGCCHEAICVCSSSQRRRLWDFEERASRFLTRLRISRPGLGCGSLADRVSIPRQKSYHRVAGAPGLRRTSSRPRRWKGAPKPSWKPCEGSHDRSVRFQCLTPTRQRQFTARDHVATSGSAELGALIRREGLALSIEKTINVKCSAQ